MHAVVVINV